jgi:hypothetical protein
MEGFIRIKGDFQKFLTVATCGFTKTGMKDVFLRTKMDPNKKETSSNERLVLM